MIFSRAYFSNILKVLKGSFREACNVYGFVRYNPAMTLRLPKMEKKKKNVKHVYAQEEIDKILTRFKDNDTFTCAFLTSCYTGMRTGEVCALTWNDIDFKNGTIHIQHNVYDKKKDEKGKWYLGSTKTKTGTTELYRLGNSGWVYDASYLSIKNVTLGYTVPLKSRDLISRLRFYITMQNLATFTQYPGISPEVSMDGMSWKGLGVDRTAYPAPRTFSLGVNVSF